MAFHDIYFKTRNSHLQAWGVVPDDVSHLHHLMDALLAPNHGPGLGGSPHHGQAGHQGHHEPQHPDRIIKYTRHHRWSSVIEYDQPGLVLGQYRLITFDKGRQPMMSTDVKKIVYVYVYLYLLDC